MHGAAIEAPVTSAVSNLIEGRFCLMTGSRWRAPQPRLWRRVAHLPRQPDRARFTSRVKRASRRDHCN
jgi:hypothetical protein